MSVQILAERIKKALATEGLELLPGVPLNVGSGDEISVYLREIKQPTIGDLVRAEYMSMQCPTTTGQCEWAGNRGAEIAIDRAIKEVQSCCKNQGLTSFQITSLIRAIAPTQEKQT